jgi:hypothetical protein
MTDIKELLVQLDMALTGHSRRNCEHTAKNQSFERGASYYLSDGGYSRVVVGFESIFVTGNSLDRVKQAWSRPDVQKIVAAISAAVEEVPS